MARFKQLGAAAVGATLALTLLPGGVAQAYDKDSAKEYADAHAISHNTYYATFHNDCTNFISQVFYAGGIAFRNSGDAEDRWYYKKSPGGSVTWSNTWTVAHDNWNLMKQIAPRWGSYPRGTQYRTTPSWHVAGDPVYYDFTGDGKIDHASINVAIGNDSKTPGWNGNLVDAHTTDRKRVIWHLRPYNAHYATTSWYFLHFDRGTR